MNKWEWTDIDLTSNALDEATEAALRHWWSVSTNARFVTHDSGARTTYETGAQRDLQEDKPRFDLIPMSALRRVAELYTRGAKKYGTDNWQKGMPLRDTYGSLFRHLAAWAEGQEDEDHLAAVVWNALTLMWTEDAIRAGALPESLATFGPLAVHPPAPGSRSCAGFPHDEGAPVPPAPAAPEPCARPSCLQTGRESSSE